MGVELCGKFEVEQDDAPGRKGVIYVMSRWHPKTFTLSITDGLNAWVCEATEEEVSRKAFSWDWTESKYLQDAEQHLGVQDPASTYSFNSLGADGARKLSWSLVKDGVQLVASWRVEKARIAQDTTRSVLDCLIQGSSKISEDLQRKNRSLEQMTFEAKRALAQSEKFKDLKTQFESDAYKRFVEVLNSKKGKLRELRALALQSRSSPTKADKGPESMAEDTQSSEDDLDSIKDEDDDGASEGNVETAARKAEIRPAVDGSNSDDGDSDATDILPPSDSPRTDEPGNDPDEQSTGPNFLVLDESEPSKSVHHPQIPQSDTMDPPVTDASLLLSGSNYTSAPKRRRRL